MALPNRPARTPRETIIRHRVDLHIHGSTGGGSTDTELKNLILNLIEKVDVMSQKVDDMTAAIAEKDTVLDSLVELVNGLPDVIGEAVRVALENANVEKAELEAAVDAATASAREDTQQIKDALVKGTGEELPPEEPVE